MKHPLQDEKKRRIYWDIYNKRFEKEEKKFIKLIREFFREQQKRVLETFDIGKSKDIIDESFNLELEIQLAKESLLPFLEEVLVEAGVETLNFANYDFNFILSSEIRSTMEARAELFATSINETTFKQLKTQFHQSVEAEENLTQLADRIEDTYDSISKGRALNIARTEIQVANQTGILNGYQQAGIPIKIWVAVMDGATRDTHAMLDGQERPMKVPFDNGLMMPGDPTGPPEEVVNCRCTI
jgi:uncharacterized protein with gpF-like domain